MSGDYYPRVEHTGKGCPVRGKTVRAQVEHQSGSLYYMEAYVSADTDHRVWVWCYFDAKWVPFRVLSYQVKKPKVVVLWERLLGVLSRGRGRYVQV